MGHTFAGVDGFGVGLGSTGLYDTAWTVELADFPRRILELREPDAEHLVDVCQVSDPPRVDVVTGGFPCQDVSIAGLKFGIRGRRSGLYAELVRIVAEADPELVLLENVPGLLHRGFELVIRDLVELGYGVEWDCIPAAAAGAPHLRDRVWIAAHRRGAPAVFGQDAALFTCPPAQAADLVGGDGDGGDVTPWQRWPRAGWVLDDPELVMPLEPLAPITAAMVRGLWPTPTTQDARNNGGPSQHKRNTRPLNAQVGGPLNPAWVEWLMGFPIGWTDPSVPTEELEVGDWRAEPPIARTTEASEPHRVARLTALGNALVPAVPAWIGERYMRGTRAQERAA